MSLANGLADVLARLSVCRREAIADGEKAVERQLRVAMASVRRARQALRTASADPAASGEPPAAHRRSGS